MELCDVTIREGDQMPGRSYSRQQKVSAATTLDELGLESIQVGFPAKGINEIVDCKAIIDAVDTKTTVIARALPEDVDAALETGADVVELLATFSDRQLKYTIGESREEMFALVIDAIDRALAGGVTVYVVLIDAFRTPTERLVNAYEGFSAIECITFADSVGARTPATVRDVLETIANAGVDLNQTGVHFHDDLGLGTANALVADQAGVRKVDVSVGSIGERAGNTPLEQVAVAKALENDSTNLKTESLISACHKVLKTLNESIPPRKPILGREVHSHEAGLHTAVMLEKPDAFEPYNPAAFGGDRSLLFGAKTGRTGARKLLERVNRRPTDDRIETLHETLAERGPVDLDTALELARQTEPDARNGGKQPD